jgi:Barrel-sandwich domain of CusB or HlyD membrane-fusion/Outer membrane efflux protein
VPICGFLPVPESAASQIHLGDPVKAHIQALNQDFEGKVSRFSDLLDRQTRTMETEIDFANKDGRLIPGMYAEAALSLARNASELRDLANSLSAIVGFQDQQTFQPVEEIKNTAPPAPDVNPLVMQALQQRPELQALTDQVLEAKKFANGEHDLKRPTISAVAAAGVTPVRSGQPLTDWYGAAGVNINIPLFNGFMFDASAKAADLQTEANRQRLSGMFVTPGRTPIGPMSAFLIPGSSASRPTSLLTWRNLVTIWGPAPSWNSAKPLCRRPKRTLRAPTPNINIA